MAAALESSLSAEISESFLQCPICLSQFLSPKVLSCQHAFCAKCLKGWLQNRRKNTDRIKCAVCCKKTVLPALGVDALPESYVIKGMISLLKEKDLKPGSARIKAGKKKAVPAKKEPTKAAAKPAPPKTGAASPKTKRKAKEYGAAIPVKVDSESKDTDSSSDEDDSDSDSDSSEDSGEEMEVPSTTTLKDYGEVKVGMEVYIFSKLGKRVSGTVGRLSLGWDRASKRCRTYAGIELAEKTTDLQLTVSEEIDVSHLSYWLGKNGKPCTVVRADDCLPIALVEKLLDSE